MGADTNFAKLIGAVNIKKVKQLRMKEKQMKRDEKRNPIKADKDVKF